MLTNNQTKYTDKSRKEGIFLYLLSLTGFFILLEISFFIQCNSGYLSEFSFIANHLNFPIAILPGVAYFLCAQLLVHFVYCVSVWCVTLLIGDLFRLSATKLNQLAISVWILGLLTALVANQYLFPNSKYAELLSLFFSNKTVTIIVLTALLSACAVLLLLASCSVFVDCVFWMMDVSGFNNKLILVKHYDHYQQKKDTHSTLRQDMHPGYILIAALSVIGLLSYRASPITIHTAATASKPNIIIVGIDSLRPDFLGYAGYDNHTPFIDSFLQQATVFAEAITPLARTFPSWTSILTGEHPKDIGIRTNLAKQDKVVLSHSLPAILRRAGYKTIYASDETRFSNIHQNYGFDRVITPPVGVNDFLLGSFNDFPLSNLLINTTVGKYLFPYSYANRPVYITYDPNSFLDLIQPVLNEQTPTPVFLSIHFCLPHNPYIWASYPIKKSNSHDINLKEIYNASINRVDKQVNDFFNRLEKTHLLDHAIVVLLSDHGEALELRGDRLTEKNRYRGSKGEGSTIPVFYPPSLDKEEVNQSAGHGTDVLGLSQYHSLLAFRLYGLGPQKRKEVNGVVSLLRIKPTILDLIDLPTPPGQSLAGVIRGQQEYSDRDIHHFIESDFSPESIRTVYPEIRKVLLESLNLFEIDPKTTRLTVKSTMEKMIISSKQYADIYNNWILALYPQNKNHYMPILLNLENGQWTNDLNSPFALESPASNMLTALKLFYGNEIGSISNSQVH